LAARRKKAYHSFTPKKINQRASSTLRRFCNYYYHPSPFFSSNRCTRFFFNASSSSDNNLRHSSTVSFELHIGYIIASIESAGFVVLLLFSRIGNFRSSNNSGMLLFAAGFLLRRRAFLFFPPILSKCPKMPLSLIWKKKKKKRVPIALQHLQ
jgi:hypothetical protein